MIYLDNAATSFRKPQCVYKASVAAMRACSSAGRGSYPASELAAEKLYECRTQLSLLFGLDSPESVAFTSNATVALNMALKGILNPGDHVVTSGYEHNAVMRPLTALARQGISFSSPPSPLFQPEQTLAAISHAVTPKTKLVVINHVSNVFGFIQPIEEIDAFCAKKGIHMIIDASQSAGVIPIDASKLQATVFLCMPGHKSLYGPQGTGVIIACPCAQTVAKRSIIEGGTGSDSASFLQPSFLPDLLESGTHNICGIAGLCEGVKFVRAEGCSSIRQHEVALCRLAAQKLSAIDGMRVFFDPSWQHQTGVLSFVSSQIDCTHMAALLAAGGFCVRAGHHCAPLAHRSAGTFESGTVRLSPSFFSSTRDIERFCDAVSVIVKNLPASS